MKVLFACGGSGGHINPAVAMAQMLMKSFPLSKCAFAGRADSMEERAALREGFPFYRICIEGFHRRMTCRNLRSAFLALKAPHDAELILKDMEAELVIGTGGYVSYPFIKAAHRLRIPCVLYEANAIPGLTFRLCERQSTRTLLQFEECLKHIKYPEKARVIGAPLRADFYTVTREKARRLLGISESTFFFLSFGGSQGAAQINRSVIEAMTRLDGENGLLHIHACGERYYESIRKEHPHLVRKNRIFPYIERMPLYMSAADLILCRAGAITLAELARLGRAAILVPSPNVSADHQMKNAQAYETKGAATIIAEKELSGERLAERVLLLRKNRSAIRRMEEGVRCFDVKETPTLFTDAIYALCN